MKRASQKPFDGNPYTRLARAYKATGRIYDIDVLVSRCVAQISRNGLFSRRFCTPRGVALRKPEGYRAYIASMQARFQAAPRDAEHRPAAPQRHALLATPSAAISGD